MRSTKTFEELINDFMSGKTEGVSATGTLTIKGNALIHYKTTIAERNYGRYIINNSRYSLATGRLQKKLLEMIPEEKRDIVKSVKIDYSGSLISFLDNGK